MGKLEPEIRIFFGGGKGGETLPPHKCFNTYCRYVACYISTNKNICVGKIFDKGFLNVIIKMIQELGGVYHIRKYSYLGDLYFFGPWVKGAITHLIFRGMDSTVPA